MDVESSACLGMEELGLLNPYGSDPKIAAPPCGKLKIILKLKKKEDEVVPGPTVVPPTATSTSSSSSLENSMKLKLEATKRKLEQRYGDEAEKKAKKKIQRIDDFPNPKNHAGSSSEVKALALALDQGDVRERLLAKMKRLKKINQNLKPKYTLYSKRPNI